MVEVGLIVRLEVKAGASGEFEDALRATLPEIEREPDTTAWFALRLGPTSYAVVDVFPDEAGRQAHLEAGKKRLQRIAELFAEPPSITPTTVIAAKLP